jgi:AcrR family transcriptional regulator
VTDDHLAARRRQILDGARRCFAEYGYEKATVRRLEQIIGLSRGAIFHHFRDKDTLFFELAREDAERMADVASREGLIQLVLDGLVARLASGDNPEKLSAVLDLVEASVRQAD